MAKAHVSSGKIKFRGRIIDVILKKVKLPNGFTVRYEMIRHPGASLIIPFISKDKIIMLRQLRPVVKSYIYELPAGTIDGGESPLACARREIIEETGYAAKKFTYLGFIYPVPGYSTEKIYLYKAEKLVERSREAEEDEVIETYILSRAEVRRLVKTRKIVDAKTLSALALCGWIG